MGGVDEGDGADAPALFILQVVDELSVVRFRLLADGELTDCDVLTVIVV